MQKDHAFILAARIAMEIRKLSATDLPPAVVSGLSACLTMIEEQMHFLEITARGPVAEVPAPLQVLAAIHVPVLASVHPLTTASAPTIVQTTAAPIATPETAQKSVLVIDDDQDMQKTLRYLLPKKGNFVVHSLVDPREAVAYLMDHQVSVVLMDLMMPQMSGFELLTKIRGEPRLASLKIIVGSSRSYDQDRITVLKVGADDFIAKPYTFSELILRLKKLAA